MLLTRRWILVIGLLSAGLLFSQGGRPQPDKPYVVLVSFDSFRYDYAQRDGAKNLIQFGKAGVAAKALIPSFPSATFPNHYTIASGLYPEHHGIIANAFFDPVQGKDFTTADTENEGAFFGGVPLWVLARQQGMMSASYYWPGSTAEIQGMRPDYWLPFTKTAPNESRVDQAIAWLQLPLDQRPHFIALYFDELDIVAHANGPEAAETRAAVGDLDGLIPRLMSGVRATGVPVDVIILSDHGMMRSTEQINVSKLADLAGIRVSASSNQASFFSQDRAALQRLYAALHGKDRRFEIYWPDQTPAHLHFRGNPRIGDLVMLAQPGIYLYAGAEDRKAEVNKGLHGYDPSTVPEMRGIFYAQGPDFRSGMVIEPFENIHVYPLIAHVLGLKTPPGIDGSLKVLAPILRVN